VTEPEAGSDLEQYLGERGTLSVEEVARLGLGVAAALVAAHRRGAIYRNLTPASVPLDADGRLRVSDFGLVRAGGGPTAASTAYASPEVLAGEPSSIRSDLYSLGMILFRALTGSVPRLTEALGHRPSKLRPEVPAWLDDAIANATAALPGDRYPSAAAMLEALAARGTRSESPGASRGITGRLDFCVICRAAEPLGVGLCANCMAAQGEETVLLFLQRSRTVAKRDQSRHTLRSMIPTAEGGGLEAVVRGERPLARVPLVAAERVRVQLARRDLSARVVTGWWAPLPASLYGVAALMTATGLAAGNFATPVFLWASPLLAAFLLLEGRRRGQDPVLRGGQSPLFGSRVARKLAVTVTRVADGTALGLLADLVRTAQELALRQHDENAPRSDLDLELLVSKGCDAASDLAALEQSTTTAEAVSARHALVQQMRDIIATLDRARVTALPDPAVGTASGSVRAALLDHGRAPESGPALGEGATATAR
jgi:hypothetical protein